jgi:hypothetical protein
MQLSSDYYETRALAALSHLDGSTIEPHRVLSSKEKDQRTEWIAVAQVNATLAAAAASGELFGVPGSPPDGVTR